MSQKGFEADVKTEVGAGANLRVSDDDRFADHKVRSPGHDDGHVVGGRGVVGRGRGRAFPGGGGGQCVVRTS